MVEGVNKCTFEDVLPYWRKLWPNRVSPIEPTSAMTFPTTGYDMSLMKNPANFLTYQIHDYSFGDTGYHTAGVFSGHRIDDTYYRGRGLWVEPWFRRRGVAQELLAALCDQARLEGCKIMWIVPRASMWPVYDKAGFTRYSEPFTEGMEFGPNLNAIKEIG